MDDPDICPPWMSDLLWWIRNHPPKGGGGPPPPDPDPWWRALDEAMVSLSIYQMAARLSNTDAQASIQRLAGAAFEHHTAEVAKGLNAGKMSK